MNTVYKYQVYPGHQRLGLQAGAHFISAVNQREVVTLYATVPTAAVELPPEFWEIEVVGTGWGMDHLDLDHFLGTVLLADGDLVFHVFARRSEA